MRPLTFIIFALGSLASYGAATDTISGSISQISGRTDSAGDPEIPSSSSDIVERADDCEDWLIIPMNGKDENKLKEIETFLEKVTESDDIFSYRDAENALRFWFVSVTKEQIDEIEQQDGVLRVERNEEDSDGDVAVPLPTAAAYYSDSVGTKVKRALEYTTQSTPASDLRMVSQPTTVPDLGDLENYVYEKHAGEGQYIYHVELGIAAAKIDEFPPNQVEFLRSKRAIRDGLPEDRDGGLADSHSTCVASKAAGQRYGSAKKATLVVVKMTGFVRMEIYSIFDTVWKDIQQKKRQKKSIVTISWGTKDPTDLKDVPSHWQQARMDIERLMKNDVIVVTSAGNDAEKEHDGKKRTEVDQAPAIFASDDYPIIVVGATDNAGNKAAFSQGGNKVAILGPGVDIECQDRSLRQPWITSGTSFSTPLVAGVLANFLSYETIPFDTSDGEVAANAKEYLIKTANWPRKPDTPVIWNGVTEDDNPKKSDTQSATPLPPPSSPVVAPAIPPAANSCVPNPPEGANVRDAHDYLARLAGFVFCHRDEVTGLVTDQKVDIKMMFLMVAQYNGDPNMDDVYDVSITSVDGCKPNGAFNLLEPVEGSKCEDIMADAWQKCPANQGRGGSIVAGCLKYEILTKA